jgi:polysaccharide biosynthesis protein PslH
MKILMLTHRLPYAPNRGDRIRAYFILRHLSRVADVHLFSMVHDEDEASRGDDCTAAASVTLVPASYWRNRAAAVAALPTRRPLTHVLLNAPDMEARFRRTLDRVQPDLVLSYCTGMAPLALAGLDAGTPFALDMVDVDSVKWRELSASSAMPLNWIYAREARCLSEFERTAVSRAAATFVVNERERSVLQASVPGAHVHVVPNGIDLSAFAPSTGPSDMQSAVFCGVMDYPPNEQAAIWTAKEIWPLVRTRVPGAKLFLVGANPTERVRRLSLDDESIVVTGSVPDVRPYLWNAAVSVAPLRTARGLQNKVLEALAARLPVVTTSAVFEGLPDSARAGCFRADSIECMAGAIAGLLEQDPAARRAMADRADLTSLEWQQQLAPLVPLLQRAVEQREEAVA